MLSELSQAVTSASLQTCEEEHAAETSVTTARANSERPRVFMTALLLVWCPRDSHWFLALDMCPRDINATFASHSLELSQLAAIVVQCVRMTVISDIPCERCGASVPWDGKALGVTCPYCKATTKSPASVQAPTYPRMAVPSGGGAAGLVIGLVVGALVLLVVVGGVLIFFLRSAPSAPPSVSRASEVPIKSSATVQTPGADIAKVVLTFGEEGDAPGQTQDARAIAVDLDENIYLADYDTGRVQKLDATGKFQWIIAVPKNSFSGDKNIWSLVCDTKNNLWVARTGDLLEYSTSDGKIKTTIKGDYDSSWFQFLALDPLGNMVAEHSSAGDTMLLFLDPSGKIKTRVKHDDTRGLAMDGSGNVYLDNEFDNTIEVLDPKGATKAKFGSKKDSHTSSPGALAVDGKGHIYVETSEGVNVFDSGGAYIATLPDSRSARDVKVSIKGNIFVLPVNGKIKKYEPGPKLK